MNKECYHINGKEYYNLKQMFASYIVFLSCEPCYNTFYKKFIKWQRQSKAEPLIYAGLKLYTKKQAEAFINEFDFINFYNDKPAEANV